MIARFALLPAKQISVGDLVAEMNNKDGTALSVYKVAELDNPRAGRVRIGFVGEFYRYAEDTEQLLVATKL